HALVLTPPREQPRVHLLVAEIGDVVPVDPASSAASNTALTDFRDMPCEDAIARPDRPSARSWSTSFALIFRTIPDCSFRRVPYTHGGRRVSRVVPNDTTAGPQRRHRYADGLVPGPSISGPQRSEYSIASPSISRSWEMRR